MSRSLVCPGTVSRWVQGCSGEGQGPGLQTKGRRGTPGCSGKCGGVPRSANWELKGGQ